MRYVVHMSTQTEGPTGYQPLAGAIPEIGVNTRLRVAREHAGLEQGALADLMGVGRNTVSNNESGKVAPRRITLRAWAMATGVDATWLETGIAPQQMPEGDPECANRDSNPEPAD
ncbi:helix-turn-helix domain-containing protein [Ornithinimicrobium sp. Arc0846-15]|nr:helix-turn-helix domain-containing protein [Ornithinimicrobium laminariae]